MKLYQLPAAFAEIELLSEDGELNEEAIRRFEELEGTLEEKCEWRLCAAENFAARAKVRQQEMERHKAAINRLSILVMRDEKAEKRLKAEVQQALEALGMRKIETNLFHAYIQANPPSVCVSEGFDLATLPEEWVRLKIELNKTEILKAHKSGGALPTGLAVIQTKSLRVT